MLAQLVLVVPGMLVTPHAARMSLGLRATPCVRMQEDAPTEAVGSGGKSLREEILQTMEEAAGFASMGAYATFRPRLTEAFGAIVPASPDKPTPVEMFGQKPAPDGSIDAAQLAQLMVSTGETCTDEEIAEMMGGRTLLTYEQWAKAMMDSCDAKFKGASDGGEKKGGFFGLFGG